MCLRHSIMALVFSLLILLGLCWPCRAEENYVISGSELSRLSEIFQRLDELNAKLQSELTVSKENLRMLEDELDTLKADLAALKDSLTQSEAELTQLQEQLQKVESLLAQASASFAEYRSAAQSQIRRLTVQRNLAALIAIVFLFT